MNERILMLIIIELLFLSVKGFEGGLFDLHD